MFGRRRETSFQVANGRVTSTALLMFWLTGAGASGGVLFTNLYSFDGGMDGAFPFATLMQASDGNLYGTTENGGALSSISGYGTIFQMTLDGGFNSLYYFQNNGDGDHPFLSGLVEDSDGLFYGTTEIGGDYGNGEIFAFFSDGFLFPIYSFVRTGGDGGGPVAGLTRAGDGNFYGTTESGGTHFFGTIFRITADWDYTNLFSFNGTNGDLAQASLAKGNDGSLYGTTFYGGTGFQGFDTGYGTIFRISTNGTFTSLFLFSGTNGAQPVAGLIQGSDGNFY